MKHSLCTCGVAAGVIVIVGHFCPVHYRQSFVTGQHPLHQHFANDTPRSVRFLVSGEMNSITDDPEYPYYSTHGD
ncbi:MAG TPA: hypothetical protein VHT95_06840 [Vicinamibacterales bacterium]|nr:hypothetical protein [Vicinamibacterales bacterium]